MLSQIPPHKQNNRPPHQHQERQQQGPPQKPIGMQKQIRKQPRPDQDQNSQRGGGNFNQNRQKQVPSFKNEQLKKPIQREFIKTKLCPSFLQRGCDKGEQCIFAHGDHELRPMPNFQKTRLWKCLNGFNCKYAHGEMELRGGGQQYSEPPTQYNPKPAYYQQPQMQQMPNSIKPNICSSFMQTGRCRNGNNCRYAHYGHENQSMGMGGPPPMRGPLPMRGSPPIQGPPPMYNQPYRYDQYPPTQWGSGPDQGYGPGMPPPHPVQGDNYQGQQIIERQGPPPIMLQRNGYYPYM